jgi:hypothetical protein
MARCKECLHYDICDYEGNAITGNSSAYEVECICEFYKNKSNFVELLGDEIIYTTGKWLMLNMKSEHLGEAIKSTIDYCTEKAKAEKDFLQKTMNIKGE